MLKPKCWRGAVIVWASAAAAARINSAHAAECMRPERVSIDTLLRVKVTISKRKEAPDRARQAQSGASGVMMLDRCYLIGAPAAGAPDSGIVPPRLAVCS